MWFNSMIREEPYPGSNGEWRRQRRLFPTDTPEVLHGCRHRAVRCRLKCHNERNPRVQLLTVNAEDSARTAYASREEGGDDVKSALPLRPGRHTCYNGWYSGKPGGGRRAEPEIHSQFGSESATRLREAGFASNRASAMAR